MPSEIPDDQLRRLAGNLGRLQGYFEARTDWWVSRENAPVLIALQRGLVNAARAGFEPVMNRNAVGIPTSPDENLAEQRPAAELRGSRLKRFSDFVQQLQKWFAANLDKKLSGEGRDLLGQAYRALFATATALERVLTEHGIDFAPFRKPLPQEVSGDHGREVIFTQPEPTQPAKLDARLVLEDTEDDPLLQTFKGQVELTHEAKQRIEAFIAEAGINFDQGNLIRFERKVQNWIEGTPPGHVLLIKVTMFSGKPEPYPNYARKLKERR